MLGMIPLHQPNAANLVEFIKEIFRGRRLRWIRLLPGIKPLTKSLLTLHPLQRSLTATFGSNPNAAQSLVA